MRLKRLFPVGLVVLVASLALIGATIARAAGGPQARGGCGNGFTLTLNPGYEAQLAAGNPGKVNGDGYVCVQNKAMPGGFLQVSDNTVPLHAQG